MSARTLNKSAVLKTVGVGVCPKILPLPAGFFQIRKNGIEFQSSTSIPEWTEMTVELETSAKGQNVRCTGVVVSCAGNRHSGDRGQVALLFTDLSKQAQGQLSQMVFAAVR